MKRLALLASLALLIPVGCLSHSARIELTPSGDRSVASAVSEEERLARVAEVVDETVTARGLEREPGAADWAGGSAGASPSPEGRDALRAVYWAGPDAPTGNRVVVSVLTDDVGPGLRVVVRDLDSPVGTAFVSELETSLVEALRKAFPSDTIEVDRGPVGPAFGP